MRRDLLLLAALVLLIRLPFLQQPVQGDDVYYLAMARNGLADPLHPMQMSYVYQGQQVWMAGHSHPPLNSYILCALLAVFGSVHEPVFHSAYLLFSLLAVFAVYFLARRFTDVPLRAALLFLAVPAFVLSGNKLEADLPFLALWLAGFALFVWERPLLASVPLALSGLAAYQAVFAAPILAYWVWLYKPGGRLSAKQWAYALALLSPAIALAAWQLFEMSSGAQLPAAQLAGYHTTWNLGGFARRVRNALALVVHLGWFLFPVLALFVFRVRRAVGAIAAFVAAAVAVQIAAPDYAIDEKALAVFSLGAGLVILASMAAKLRAPGVRERRESEVRFVIAEKFLAGWVLLFFCAALMAFYAGAARYLLPVAAPLAILAARSASTSWVAAGVSLQLALSLLLSTAYYQYVSEYRNFALSLRPLAESRRVWFNADWGLRYYLESVGAEALLTAHPLQPQTALVSSDLGGSAQVQAMGPRREVARAEIRSDTLPLTVIGLGSHSGNASAEFGLLPFGYGNVLLDEVKAEVIGSVEPSKAYVTMTDPDAENHLLLGFYQPEQQWRWMGPRAKAVLRGPNGPANFELVFHIPETAPARTLTVEIDGRQVARETYAGPGGYTLRAGPMEAGGIHSIEISADRSFRVEGDSRELAIVVTALGFIPAAP